MRLFSNRVLSVSMGSIAIGMAPAAHSQSAATAGILEEVIVTATRTESTVDRVSMSISALSEKAMEAQGIKTVDDIARTVPGMTFRNTGAEQNTQVTIRGVGGFNSTVGAATTGVYLDDTNLTQRNTNGARTGNGSPFPQLFDLERVEVLRGPQGTLYGGSSEGGTVRFITPTPSLTEFSARARAELATTSGGDPSYELAGAMGGPIIEDKLALRVSGIYRRDGGWIDGKSMYDGHTFAENINHKEKHAFRAVMKWAISDTFAVTPAVYVSRDYSNFQDSFWLPNPEYRYPGGTIYNGSPAPELVAVGGAAYATGACTSRAGGGITSGPCTTSSGARFAFPNVQMPAFTQAATPWYGDHSSTGIGLYRSTTDVRFQKSPRTTELMTPSLTIDKDFGSVLLKFISSYVDVTTEGFDFQGGSGGGVNRYIIRFAFGPVDCDPAGLVNFPRTTGLAQYSNNGLAATSGGRCYRDPMYMPGIPGQEDYFNFMQERQAFTQELRLSSAPGGRFQWVAGVYFDDSKLHMHAWEYSDEAKFTMLYRGAGPGWYQGNYALPIPGSGLSPPAAFGNVSDRENWTDETEIAAFGEGNFNITEAFKVTAGVRVSNYEQKYRQIYGGLVAGLPPAGSNYFNPTGYVADTAAFQAASRNPALPNSATNPIVNPASLAPFAVDLAGCPMSNGCPLQYTKLESEEKTVAPKFGLTYEFSDTNLVYATYAKGFRPGGVNPPLPPQQCVNELNSLGLSSTPETYDQDTVNSYEVGSKVRLLGGRLQLNTSVFLIDWIDMQINMQLTCGFGVIINAAQAESKGAEVSANGRFGPVSINANIGYNKAVFAEDIKNSAGALIQNKGDNLGSPDWTIALAAQYDMEMAGHDSFIRVDYNYAGEYMRGPGPNTVSYNPYRTDAPSTQVWNGRIGMNFDRVDVALFVQNLTDTDTFINLGGGASRTADPAVNTASSFRPRTIGVQASYRY